MDDDTLDGCDLDFTTDPTGDPELVALFADCTPDQFDARRAEWGAILNAS